MNTKLWIIVVILIAAGAFFWLQNGSPSSTTKTTTPTHSSAPTAKPSATKGAQVTTSPDATPSMTYTQLVQMYAGKTLQFSESCQVTPKSFVLKNNTAILLDNRSASAKTIVIEGRSYSLGAYGYQVVTVSSSSLPSTLHVNCDSSVNVGTINLQAEISGQ